MAQVTCSIGHHNLLRSRYGTGADATSSVEDRITDPNPAMVDTTAAGAKSAAALDSVGRGLATGVA